MELAKNIKKIRRRWKLDQQEFAELLDSKSPRISTYELAKVLPGIDFILRLQNLTDINVKDLAYKKLTPYDIPENPLLENTFVTKKEIDIEELPQKEVGAFVDAARANIDVLRRLEKIELELKKIKKVINNPN